MCILFIKKYLCKKGRLLVSGILSTVHLVMYLNNGNNGNYVISDLTLAISPNLVHDMFHLVLV